MTLTQPHQQTNSILKKLDQLGRGIAAKAIVVFIVLLPLHSLIITLLIAQAKLPFGVARAIAAWKEGLLVLTFLIAMLTLVWRFLTAQPFKLNWLDWVGLGWIGAVLLYFGLQEPVFSSRISLVGKSYGARDWMLYIMPYFIGRLLPLDNTHTKNALHLIFVVGFATSLIGILEYFFVPIEWHVRLGVPIYFRDFLNTYVLKWLYDLPSNYWAEATPTSVIRRAVSVYINGQSFALPFLVVAPVSAYFFFNKPNLLRGIALATVFMGLALNLTRMTMLVCIVQTFLLLAFMRKWKIIGGVIVGLAIGLLIGVMISPRINSFVRRTISGEETSVSTRSQQWVEGIEDLLANPLGHGLGYAGQVGFRTGPAGTEGQGQEAGYFKLTGDMGVVGLGLFVVFFAGVLANASKLLRRTKSSHQHLALITALIAIGFLINNITAPPDQSPFVIYLFPWLAGVMTTRAEG